MSSAPGVYYLSRFYSLRFGSNVLETVLYDPFGESSFEADDRRFLAQLAPHVPAATAIVEAARADLPIVELRPDYPMPGGVVIEDDPDAGNPYLRKQPAEEVEQGAAWFAAGAARRARVNFDMEEGRISIGLAVAGQVRRSALNRLGKAIAREVFAPEPAAAPEGGPPPHLAALRDATAEGPRFKLGLACGGTWVDARHEAFLQEQHASFAREMVGPIAEALGRLERRFPAELEFGPLSGAVRDPARLLRVTGNARLGLVDVTLEARTKDRAEAVKRIERELFQALELDWPEVPSSVQAPGPRRADGTPG